MKTEYVLSVPTSALHDLGYFHGFSADSRYRGLIGHNKTRFIPRDEAEQDPEWKQLIPYVVINYGDAVFSYTRGGGGGESRLHALKSIGIGGHVKSEDGDGAPIPSFANGLMRELTEEVNWPGFRPAPRWIGAVNHDDTKVAQVHLGMVYLVSVPKMDGITSNEPEIEDAMFRPLSVLARDVDSFEPWSAFILKSLQYLR